MPRSTSSVRLVFFPLLFFISAADTHCPPHHAGSACLRSCLSGLTSRHRRRLPYPSLQRERKHTLKKVAQRKNKLRTPPPAGPVQLGRPPLNPTSNPYRPIATFPASVSLCVSPSLAERLPSLVQTPSALPAVFSCAELLSAPHPHDLASPNSSILLRPVCFNLSPLLPSANPQT